MRMTKMPYESKYRKILAEARDYIREYQEYRKRQIALGLWVEEENQEGDASKKGNANDTSRRTSFISEETENALKDAKQKLAEVL